MYADTSICSHGCFSLGTKLQQCQTCKACGGKTDNFFNHRKVLIYFLLLLLLVSVVLSKLEK